MSTLFTQINSVDTHQLVDMTQVKTGGGGRGLLPTGTAIVRFSSYVELGSHVQTFGGQAKPAAPQFKLGFHIVGGGGINKEGKGEPYVQEAGQFPFVSTFDTAMSQHEKAKAVKYFNALNRVGNKATHFIHKLSEQCLYALPISVVNRKGKDYNEIDFTNLQVAVNPTTYQAYTDEDMPKLEDKHIQVFLWEQPTKEMWDSIEIEGEWEAQKDAAGNITAPARSKNFLQEKCLTALNFEGSALQLLLQEIGADYKIPELSTTPEPVAEVPDVPSVPELPSGTVPEVPDVPAAPDVPTDIPA